MALAPNSPAARDVAYNIHPYTNLAVHEEKGPLIVSKGEGIYVYDDDGQRYIEGLAGLWCTGLGFSENRLAEAAMRQLQEMPYTHTFAHRSSMPVIELAEKLINMAPAPLSKAYFVNSGSEAIDAAIKFIWYYNNSLDRPEKKKIIGRKRGYHGITIAGGHLTALAYARNGFDLPIERFLYAETPCYYRCGHEGESEDEFSTRLAQELDDMIQEEGPETVAAFVAEPVMGAGGVMVPPVGYFEKVQAVLKKHDVLMVADEVICGFGRTGNMFGSETYNIQPDLMTCAKQLSSAYLPIGAVLVSEPIYQGFVEYSKKLGVFGIGHTYGGHPVPAAVALETLKIYEDDDIIGHVRSVSKRFMERVEALNDKPLVGESRGVGLICGIEVVADKATKEQYPAEVKAAAKVQEACLARGLVVRALQGDVVGVCPPLIITEAQIDELFDIMEAALEDAAAQL